MSDSAKNFVRALFAALLLSGCPGATPGPGVSRRAAEPMTEARALKLVLDHVIVDDYYDDAAVGTGAGWGRW